MKFKSVVVCMILLMSMHLASSAFAGKKKQSAKDKETAALKAESKENFKTGMSLVQAEDFAAAAVAFESAYELYPTNGVLYNLSECYKANHRYKEWYEALILLESKLGDSRNDKKLKPLVENRVKEITRIIGFLTIGVDQSGASIAVNGKEIGTSPLEKPIVLGLGTYEVSVALDGYGTVVREIKIKPKAQLEETFELVPVENVEHTDDSMDDTRSMEGTSLLKPLFWSGVAGTALTGIASGVFWGLTAKQSGAVDDEYTKLDKNGTNSTDSIDKLDEKRVTYNKAAIGFSIAAGAFAVGTAVLFVLDRQIIKEEDSEAVDVSILPGSLIVSF